MIDMRNKKQIRGVITKSSSLSKNFRPQTLRAGISSSLRCYQNMARSAKPPMACAWAGDMIWSQLRASNGPIICMAPMVKVTDLSFRRIWRYTRSTIMARPV
jgi:hypothetical protein